MKRIIELPLLLLLLLAPLAGCGAGGDSAEMSDLLADGISVEDLSRRVAQFAPAEIDFDDSVLEPWEREVLTRLIEASDIMQELFLTQVSPRNPEWRSRLERARGEGREAALAYFDIMAGPWDRLDRNRPFLNFGEKPAGAGYYPADLTREDLEEWLRSHPEDRQRFTDYFSLIRREKGNLIAVPYSVAYREQLERAASLLREAARHSENESLTRYLEARAAAFLSDDYFESDMAWMDLDSRIEPTIGPYEVYEDRLMGYKAAFESFLTVADPAASAELERLKDAMPELERRLPYADRYKNLDRGFESPIRVVDVVYTAGDTRAGSQTIAFNLPNDVRVQEQKGSKKVMLRNVMQAKFDKVLSRIGAEVLVPELQPHLAFQPWFVRVLMHELAHGLGPSTITLPSGAQTTVHQALQDRNSALEEAKADAAGLHSLTVLASMGHYDEEFVRQAFLGHIADLFRSVRFGTNSAHGMAGLIQFNYLVEKGAVTHDAETGRFDADYRKLVAANRDLAREILTIQAEGSYEKAGEILEKYGTIRPEMQAAIDRLAGVVPVDIRPQYKVLEKIANW